MYSPVAIAGCAINLIIAAICLYVRYRQGGRDWLSLFAGAHLAAAAGYGLIVPFPPGPALQALLNTPGGYAVGLAVILSAAGFASGSLRLRYQLPAWRIAACLSAMLVLVMLVVGQAYDPYAALQIVFPLNVLTSILAGGLFLLGPTAFYRLTGISWLGRAVMAMILAFLPATPEGQSLFLTVGVLNIILISATGFGLILIELDHARRQAAEASHAKTQFIANMSHELRTPLNAIIGFSEILEGRAFSPTPEQGRHYASLILQSGRHLLGMVNALLDMATIEARGEKLQTETVRADSLVTECTAMLAADAATKQIDLQVVMAGQPVEVMTDPRALRQILLNLIGNAIKFSPPMSVVRIDLELSTGNAVTIRVADHGPGISAADLPRIFDPFFQCGNAYNRAKGGVGLGLAIAQRLAIALGGSIAVDSREGAGSAFAIILPQAVIQGSQPA